MKKPKIVIIVAGGKGIRMNTDIPKQFIEIQGKPILMHTCEVFLSYNHNIQLIVVLPANEIEYWDMLCNKYAFRIPHKIVTGGTTRFESVKNGLNAVKLPCLIAVHDGVRPLVSKATIQRCFDEAEKCGTAIPVVNLSESIRQITPAGSQSVDRSTFKLVQTPQVFDGAQLKKAYQQEFSTYFTDDASVVEAMGMTISMVEGNIENIKITTKLDLKIADVLMQKTSN
jgi:2-C-methyl-D-erythritol 4-phosphate cytidylyltransferase